MVQIKVVATADLHGHLPVIPPCDILLIAGDVCPTISHDVEYQESWLDRYFVPWVGRVPAAEVFMCWGNHDFVGLAGIELETECIGRAVVLTDRLRTTGHGLKIYGTPWTKTFMSWAFMLDEPELAIKHQQIPQCDILITHGPPALCGDYVPGHGSQGSHTLSDRLGFDLIPKLVVFGHIHEKSGAIIEASSGWRGFNVSHVDENYVPVLPPVEITLEI